METRGCALPCVQLPKLIQLHVLEGCGLFLLVLCGKGWVGRVVRGEGGGAGGRSTIGPQNCPLCAASFRLPPSLSMVLTPACLPARQCSLMGALHCADLRLPDLIDLTQCAGARGEHSPTHDRAAMRQRVARARRVRVDSVGLATAPRTTVRSHA